MTSVEVGRGHRYFGHPSTSLPLPVLFRSIPVLPCAILEYPVKRRDWGGLILRTTEKDSFNSLIVTNLKGLLSFLPTFRTCSSEKKTPVHEYKHCTMLGKARKFSASATANQNSLPISSPAWAVFWGRAENKRLGRRSLSIASLVHRSLFVYVPSKHEAVSTYQALCYIPYLRDICTLTLITVPVTIAKLWNQPRCPTTEEWVKQMD